jgi:hypothetical protein
MCLMAGEPPRSTLVLTPEARAIERSAIMLNLLQAEAYETDRRRAFLREAAAERLRRQTQEVASGRSSGTPASPRSGLGRVLLILRRTFA